MKSQLYTDINMSGRVNVVLPDEIYETLKDLAESDRRSQSQMAAILIEEALSVRGVLPNEGSKTPIPMPIKGKGGK